MVLFRTVKSLQSHLNEENLLKTENVKKIRQLQYILSLHFHMLKLDRFSHNNKVHCMAVEEGKIFGVGSELSLAILDSRLKARTG